MGWVLTFLIKFKSLVLVFFFSVMYLIMEIIFDMTFLLFCSVTEINGKKKIPKYTYMLRALPEWVKLAHRTDYTYKGKTKRKRSFDDYR